MDDIEYSQIKNFVTHGILPDEFVSTKGNFVSKCKKLLNLIVIFLY